MGTFGGHALPGSFFIIFAVWWAIQTFRRYFQAISKHGTPFRATVTFPCTCLCGKLKTWEVEGFLKILFTGIGFTGEIVTGFYQGHFAHLGNGQHATMFFFFGMSGVVDIMLHHRMPLPKNLDYAVVTLAFSIEALLFKFHLHGRTDLDVLLHTLLLYAIYGCILSVLMEMRFRSSVLACLCRSFFTLLQGLWFWQVGFILYNPVPGAKPWDPDNHGQMMVATMMFAWHVGVAFVLLIVLGTVIGCVYKVKGHLPSSGEYDLMKMQLIKQDANGHTIVNLHDDSDSDVEFERLPTRNAVQE